MMSLGLRLLALGTLVLSLTGASANSGALSTEATNSCGSETSSLAIAASSSEIHLGFEPVRIALVPRRKGESFSSAVDTLRSNEQLYLVLKNVRGPTRTGTIYHLYLNAPQANAAEVPDQYIDSIYPFDKAPQCLAFDVTGAAKLLGAKTAAEGQATVTIVPQPLASAQPSEGAAVEQHGLSIGAIELIKQAD
jgi:hypothetical protein